jgi:peptidoglycan/LPS O-acetylase OafA/YrhL
VLIIAGGTAAPRRGVEWLLRLAPFKWLGRWSYSYYLWHWPILIFAAQYWGHPTVVRNLALACFALGVSALSYFYVENPIRHSKLLNQSSSASIAAGAVLIVMCFGLASVITA